MGVKNYKAYMKMFRACGTDNYLAQAIDTYKKTNKELKRFGLQLRRQHRNGRREQ
jgi:hypothetical protein